MAKIEPLESLKHLPELTPETLIAAYRNMLLGRQLDKKIMILLRQGKGFFHIGNSGHEAAQCAAALAFKPGSDWFYPYYRDMTFVLQLGVAPEEVLMGTLARRGDPGSGGRQMPSHWSLRRANVVSHSSPVATQTTHAAGIGLGIKMRGDDAVVLTSTGEGSTSQGEWYEGVNWAAVHKLPVIFLVENNVYAISVRMERQMAVKHVADKAKGLGLPGVTVDGTDLFAVHKVMEEAVARARNGEGPTLVEARVHRLTPHSSDGEDRTYRPREEIEAIKKQDPLEVFRRQLMEQGVLTEAMVNEMEARAKEAVEDAVAYAEAAPYPGLEVAKGPVYAEEIREREGVVHG